MKPGTKQPAIQSWTSYQTNLPNEARRQEWRVRFGDHGIGVNTGTEIYPGEILVGIDVDDDRLVRLVEGMVGGRVCAKRGKKGMTLFVRAPKSEGNKSTKLTGDEGLGNIDILAGGRFTVLPPSIHPETEKPYQWIGPNLLELDFNTLPFVDKRVFDLIGQAIGSTHAEALTTGSSTHDAGVSLVAELVSWGATDEEVDTVVHGLLPTDYAGNSLEELPGWISSAREKGYDQQRGGQRSEPKQSEQMLAAVEGTGYRLFRNTLGEPHIWLPGKTGGHETHRLRSQATKDYLRHAYDRKMGKPPSANAVGEALDHLEAVARFDSPVEDVHIRDAGHDGNVFIDLGDDTNRAVKVTARGWELVAEPPVNFVRPSGTFGALPPPEYGFDPESLREILGISMPNFILLVAFCISALNPSGPYFLLQIHGEQGSGKSNIGKFAKGMIDPNRADKLRLPKTEQELVLHAQAHWLLNYDNASFIPHDLSDLLCTVATGGAFSKRQLYTDGDLVTYVFMRPVILNGIGNYATRPDLQERSVPLNLTAIPKGKRRTEREMVAELGPLRPKFLGYLLDCVSHALANLDEVSPPRSVRMADAAHWLVASEGATRFPKGGILDALEQVQGELLAQTAADDGLTSAILTLLLYRENYEFEGFYGQLHELLTPDKAWSAKWLPRSPSALSSKLSRLAPGLRSIGIEIEPGTRTSGGQAVILRLTDDGVALARATETARNDGQGAHDQDF